MDKELIYFEISRNKYKSTLLALNELNVFNVNNSKKVI